MGRFTKIEVHFSDEDLGTRRIVVLPNSGVQAIFLRGSEGKLPFMKDVPRAIINPNQLDGIIVEGQVLPRVAKMFTGRGPGDVCYLQNGVLKCWAKT
ncbi:MAG TPA: hypothetical protein VH762_11270 [Gemmatimonadaceae bacterium]|jgi:hypothetical protein